MTPAERWEHLKRRYANRTHGQHRRRFRELLKHTTAMLRRENKRKEGRQ